METKSVSAESQGTATLKSNANSLSNMPVDEAVEQLRYVKSLTTSEPNCISSFSVFKPLEKNLLGFKVFRPQLYSKAFGDE
ncbi:hypothetical protein CDAR_4131 [Caerostris darwini]|uniref:Uncharacterized protein n=1 Tax=Caerostris darwini TaxID=1538125 RepID=A0AAV4N4J6_9ARAC|nr:hypothetical protein CDAR_4131 [Caerostris darwini]